MDLKYVFPELIIDNEINNTSDNFLVGLISYYLLNKENEDLFVLLDNNLASYKNAYNNTNIIKKIKKIKDDTIEDFLTNLLEKNPDKRMGIQEVLQHKWLQKFNSKEISSFKKRAFFCVNFLFAKSYYDIILI